MSLFSLQITKEIFTSFVEPWAAIRQSRTLSRIAPNICQYFAGLSTPYCKYVHLLLICVIGYSLAVYSYSGIIEPSGNLGAAVDSIRTDQ